ncbi:MAG: hypothetical protein FWH53_06265 [Leptospirales bacterium]|nr:hypothetical protein [Leptospirales bacterium]
MDVQNISGSDIVVNNFTPEYTPRNEQVPSDQAREVAVERPVEPNKGQSIDSMA